MALRQEMTMCQQTFAIIYGSSISEETYVIREDLQCESIIDRNAVEGINSTYCAQYKMRQLVSATISIILIVQRHDRHANDETDRYIRMNFFLNHAHGIRSYQRMDSNQLSVLLCTHIYSSADKLTQIRVTSKF